MKIERHPDYPKNPNIIWDNLEKKSEVYVKKFQTENTLFVNETEKRYIGIGILADQQIGNSGVDYKKAREDAQIIGKTNNAYALLGGDGVDNFITGNLLAPLIHQEVNPNNQVKAFGEYLSFFNNHILAGISGNHEARTDNVSGLDVIEKLFGGRMMYAKDEFKIELKLNRIIYKIHIRHKYRFNSNLNLTHSVKQMIRMGEWNPDIGIICHNHEFAVEKFIHQGEKRLAIRPGSYLVADSYARVCGFNQTIPLMPFVILSPFDKTIMDFDSIEEGCKYLEYLNSDFKPIEKESKKKSKKKKD